MSDAHRSGRWLLRRRSLVLIGCACLCALGVLARPALAPAGAPRPASAGKVAPVFASADQTRSGTELELRSVATGRVVKRLARFGDRFTNNGLALSPDGRSVYFTLIPRGKRWTSLLLDRVSVGDRRPKMIGPGEQPAVSPDGRMLAYTTDAPHDQRIVITSLADGVRHSVNVSRLLGRYGDLLNASLAWVNDDSTIAVLPGEIAVATPAARARRASQGWPSAGLIVIQLRAGGAPRSARRVALHGRTGNLQFIATDAAQPNTVLAAALPGPTAAIDRIRLSSMEATARRILQIRNGFALGIDPTGQRVIYLQGHNPPALWRATIAGRHLVDARRLIRNSPVGALSW